MELPVSLFCSAVPWGRMWQANLTRRALALEIHGAGTLHSGEHVVDCLTTQSNKFAAHNARHEILRNFLHGLGAGAVEALAENGGHGAGERLHFGAELYSEMGATLLVDVKKDSDFVCAFIIFANVFEVECVALYWLMLASILREADEHFSTLSLWEVLEEFEDLLEFFGKGAHLGGLVVGSFDGHADHISPFRPTTVVVANVFEA